MDRGKTRVWHGGLAAITEAAKPKPPPGSTAGKAPEPERERPPERTPESQILGLHAKPGSRTSRPGTRTLVGHIDLRLLQQRSASDLFSTRVMPIESLLVGKTFAAGGVTPGAGAESAEESRAQEAETRPGRRAHKPRLNLSQVRRGLIVVLGLPALGLWAWGPPQSPARAPAERAGAAERPEASHAPPAAKAKEVSETVELAKPGSPAGLPRPRSAVDALAAGDYVTAQRIYAALARGSEGRSAYSEAARILAERLQNGSF